MNLNEIPLTPEQLTLAETIYRTVGKREAGWQFDAALIPGYILMPLIFDYQTYLKEVELLNDDKVLECEFLFQTLDAAYQEAA